MLYQNESEEISKEGIGTKQQGSKVNNSAPPPFEDNRPESNEAASYQLMADNSPQSKEAIQLQDIADQHSKKEKSDSPILQKQKNNTGMPDHLKSGIENLSGYSMDDTKVHYNSDKPAQLNAHAYAQGTDIHLASGQEKHLPHEAWHVVQQKQGRVKPTMQMKGKYGVNDDDGLEKEADVMGGKALQTLETQEQVTNPISPTTSTSGNSPVQRIRMKLDHGIDNIMNNVRSSPVPEPGTIMQDGFTDYQNNHEPIGFNENIVLEGHGTYLNDDHDEDANYDSQAYLTPQQLANVAFLVPKGADWKGQIILFGCNTGPLTMEVSRHYLALSGQSVNVVGTLADIRMEVPNSQHPDGHDRPTHTAEYDQGGNQQFPMAPNGNISARGRVRAWLTQGLVAAGLAKDSIKEFSDIEDEELANNGGRNNLRQEITPFAQGFNDMLDIHLNYQGLTYSGRDDSLRQIAMIREMMISAIGELVAFEEMLGDNDNLARLQDKAVMFNTFFDTLTSELQVLARILQLAEDSYPEGTVDWEGENVTNSRAEDAGDLDGVQMDRGDINSDEWGGGGQMLMLQQMIQYDDDEENLL